MITAMLNFASKILVRVLALFLACPLTALAEDLNLPELGGGSASLVTPRQEHDIGQAWLRLYRSRVPEYADPELEQYLITTLTRVANASELEDKRLELIVVDNAQINAFAAPGGIIGVHTGLLLSAQSEGEMAGVLAHELAHLSQRHWARGVQASRDNLLPTMAGLLAGLVLIATSNGSAGMAAITSTQAASLQSSLRFNRQHEQEADSIGIKTLEAAGFDPTAMTSMFERMLDATRFMGQRPPEFLLSHPVTERRIADSRSRTTNMASKRHADNLDYHLMRARVRLHHEETPQMAAKRFQGELDGKSVNMIASRYGLALAQIRSQQYADAEKNLRILLADYPQHSSFMLALAQLNLEQSKFADSIANINAVLQKQPNYYPARRLQATVLTREKKFSEAERVLYRLSQDYPSNTQVWYELAEIRGLAKNISGVHLARAEYFILNGVYDKARQHFNYALKLLEGNFIETERIKQRLLDIDKLEKISLKI